jgi:hypothetical protein
MYEYVILHSIADEPSKKIENAFYYMKIIGLKKRPNSTLPRNSTRNGGSFSLMWNVLALKDCGKRALTDRQCFRKLKKVIVQF